jgi:3-dehydroquinate dehydratase / shikimate dehydrogenase
MQGFELESLLIGGDHSQKVKESPIRSDYGSKHCVNLSSSTAVSRIKGKRVVIIGAGGAARAIAYEACRRGASVTIVNRDAEKAHRLADKLSCFSKGLDQMHVCASEGYDLLINTTPDPMPIPSECVLSTAMVMDIKTRPIKTAFIRCALEKGCPVIYGYQMFIEQALGQFALWFENMDNKMNSLSFFSLDH